MSKRKRRLSTLQSKIRLSDNLTRRIDSARRSLLAIRNFGHNEPAATELADRFQIPLSTARILLQQVFGDVIVERAPRFVEQPPLMPLPSRGLGFGNVISIP